MNSLLKIKELIDELTKIVELPQNPTTQDKKARAEVTQEAFKFLEKIEIYYQLPAFKEDSKN